MKTELSTVCAAMLLLLLAVVVQAQDFTYTTNSDNTINITGYNGTNVAVAIPTTTNGMPVSSIGDGAFANRTGLTSVTIPNSVTNIGGEAFYSCTSLTSIIIPDSVTSIDRNAFSCCTSLTNVLIGNSVIYISLDATEGQGAFAGCTNLTSVTIPNSALNIGDWSFIGCSSLTNVVIGNSVTNIAEGAFGSCASLTSVTIPDSVISIGVTPGACPLPAFHHCTSLTNVTIGKGVTFVADNTFRYCSNLKVITVDSSNSVYSSSVGVLFNKSHTTLIIFPAGKTGSYSIPTSVNNIGELGFADSILTNVTIPNSVTSIGHAAFANCTNLITITIPDSVNNIGEMAFMSSTGLTGLYFEGNAPGVGSFVFYGDTNAIIYYLPGTTNWGPIFCGLPTALWRPRVSGDGNFGVRTNQFGFDINWASGMVFVVEACTNLANPIWSPLQTNTLTGDSSYFSDPNSTNCRRRFYRVRWE